MLSEKDFAKMMEGVVAQHFPENRLAYSEVSAGIAASLYRGEGTAAGATQQSAAEMKFGVVEGLAVVGSVVSVIDLAKYAAEAYKALTRLHAGELKSAPEVAKELEANLIPYLGPDQAQAVATTIAGRIAGG